MASVHDKLNKITANYCRQKRLKWHLLIGCKNNAKQGRLEYTYKTLVPFENGEKAYLQRVLTEKGFTVQRDKDPLTLTVIWSK